MNKDTKYAAIRTYESNFAKFTVAYIFVIILSGGFYHCYTTQQKICMDKRTGAILIKYIDKLIDEQRDEAEKE